MVARHGPGSKTWLPLEARERAVLVQSQFEPLLMVQITALGAPIALLFLSPRTRSLTLRLRELEPPNVVEKTAMSLRHLQALPPA